MNSINVVTLPRTCFAVVPLDYPCDQNTLKIEKFALQKEDHSLNSFIVDNENVEEIISNKEESLYVHLDVRKYLMVDAQLKSGKVQGLSCNYHIYTNQDEEQICVMQVGDLINGIQVDNYINDHQNYNRAKELLKNAIDFDLIDESDYVRMTYRRPERRSYRDNKDHWHISDNHDRIERYTMVGMNYPSDKKIISLSKVLKYCNNRAITPEESDKIKRLLGTRDTEKIALTILNGINPDKCFVELLCLINQMDSCIAKNNPNVPILPLLSGAYGTDSRTIRNTDSIVKEYNRVFSKLPSVDVLERIADNYYHPRLERSSVFDFKLKIKKSCKN